MLQQSSQQKQVLKAEITTAFIMIFDSENKSTQNWKINFHFANTNMRKNTLQPGEPPLDSINDKICLIQRLSESCFQQLFCMSWPCFINLLHLIEPDPIFYNQSQNPPQDLSIQLDVTTCFLGSNGNGAAVLRLKNLLQQSKNCDHNWHHGQQKKNIQNPPYMEITTMIARRGQVSLILL
ncbi:uncharacterized protein VP01_5787g1 [Puccinia sorghi]|uniref:Uncharacterized protein n=1 Tax=Puccinia sorghi TaxID=27349 RepID=A0A0L6UI85_9BASI|nr:uncharacterized protein VP01_5787g1 [Puccinia sorghi]